MLVSREIPTNMDAYWPNPRTLTDKRFIDTVPRGPYRLFGIAISARFHIGRVLSCDACVHRHVATQTPTNCEMLPNDLLVLRDFETSNVPSQT
jgi:hypothetical protein